MIGEEGLYSVTCTLQWGMQAFPETGTIVFLLNGQETAIRQQVATYGAAGKGSGAKSPYASISVPVSGKLRCTTGDILAVQCYYTSAESSWALMQSYSDAPSQVQSHMEVSWLCP